MSNQDWARGIPIPLLKALGGQIKAEYKGYVHGSFGMPKERDIASAIAEGRALWTAERDALLMFKQYKSLGLVSDFRGKKIQVPRGDLLITCLVGPPEQREKLMANLQMKLRNIREAGRPQIWAIEFMERPERVAYWKSLGLHCLAVNVTAASEILGLFGPLERSAPLDYPEEELEALKILGGSFISEEERLAVLQEIQEAGEIWADHYSSYNKRSSWKAFALKGYDPVDPFFIIKPGEMSKKWKEENPDRLKSRSKWTDLVRFFPASRKIVDRIPGEKDRVRFMWLRKGNGELTRHADITDREAGLEDGQIVRLHIPIQTNPGVIFNGWKLSGEQISLNMPERSLCYLDQRKPHTAWNEGEEDRIHLVVDVHSSEAIRSWIREGLPV